MTTKHLSLRLDPDDFSWLIRKAESLGKFPDDYVEELIQQARALDGMSGKEIHHKDGDPRNLELSNLELRDADPLITAHQGYPVDARDNIPKGC